MAETHLRSITPPSNVTRDILQRRMLRPQRHRLLHGFPLAAAMPTIGPEEAAQGMTAFPLLNGAQRALLVGVLPHPFCNPTVRGCGFCTFPHEQFQAVKAAAVAEQVIREIDLRLESEPELSRHRVSGLYFGGGTANLTPSDAFRAICRKLHQAFDFTDAEITLEGVPAYFIKREPLLLEILDAELLARHRRISMGIQSFDEQRLKAMGRLGYGTGRVFGDVVRFAHQRGMTASGDLLFNLPNQSLAEMQADVRQAIEIGLDHLGLYHLVAFRGLQTAWSQDPQLLAQLPQQARAVDNWLALRQQLLDAGFVQTSLTNFERQEFAGKPRRFQYEESSFQPDRFAMLGFGPSAISSSADKRFESAWKTINPDASHDYILAVQAGKHVVDRVFHYDRADLKAFYLTRRLSALEIDRQRYHDLFGTDPFDDYAEELSACLAEGLLDATEEAIRPTPRGIFYSDSISALFAAPRLSAHRRNANERTRLPRQLEHGINDNARGYM